MKRTVIIVAVLVFVGVSASAFAAWPEGQWTFKFFDDTTWNQPLSTHGICIQPGGTWYGTTFPAWSGTWFMKGNDLHMRGNYAGGDGNDAFELTKIGGWHMDGYWQEWQDTYDVIWATSKWDKKSNQCDPPSDAAVDPDSNPGESGGRGGS